MGTRAEEAEGKIRAAVEEVRSRGWMISGGVWASVNVNDADWKFCCPLAAVAGPEEVAELDFRGAETTGRACRKLGISISEAHDFISGFDGVPSLDQDPSAWYRLGRDLREELLP